MSATIMEGQLREAITGDAELARLGCRPHARRSGGIAIEHNGKVIGTWYWRNGLFVLVRSGSPDPLAEVETVAEALLSTRQRLTRSP